MCEDLGYGGDLHPLLASYANNNIPKQEMVIKKDKETPVRIRVPDVPDFPLDKPVLDSYIEKIFSQPFYLTKEEIYKQIDARISNIQPEQRSSDRTSRHSSTAHHKPDNPPVKKSVSIPKGKPPGY